MAAAASSAGAAISSMMTLMRKQSFRTEFVPINDYSQEDATEDNLEWMNKPGVKFLFRLTGLLSFISTCMNTPKTFEYFPLLQYVTFFTDILCAIILTFEAAAKMKIRGVFIGDSAYLKDRWNHFDAMMVISIYLSVILQVRKIDVLIFPMEILTLSSNCLDFWNNTFGQSIFIFHHCSITSSIDFDQSFKNLSQIRIAQKSNQIDSSVCLIDYWFYSIV